MHCCSAGLMNGGGQRGDGGSGGIKQGDRGKGMGFRLLGGGVGVRGKG